MPRANRRRPVEPRGGDLSRVQGLITATEDWAGQAYAVRRLRPGASGRVYTCPGCQQDVSSAVAHVVVWPADGLTGVDNRRHWHAPCWNARDRRAPRGSWK